MSDFTAKDTDSRVTSEQQGTYAKVYSTSDSVKIEFACRDVECGAWLTPNQAAELIQLIQNVLVEEDANV